MLENVVKRSENSAIQKLSIIIITLATQFTYKSSHLRGKPQAHNSHYPCSTVRKKEKNFFKDRKKVPCKKAQTLIPNVCSTIKEREKKEKKTKAAWKQAQSTDTKCFTLAEQ